MPSSDPETITGVMARIIDPEAWREPLRREGTYVVRRGRSLKKVEKIFDLFWDMEMRDKLVEAINDAR